VIRIGAFTVITTRGLWPDILSLLPIAPASQRIPMVGFLVLGTAFNALMLWPLAEAVWKAGKGLGSHSVHVSHSVPVADS